VGQIACGVLWIIQGFLHWVPLWHFDESTWYRPIEGIRQVPWWPATLVLVTIVNAAISDLLRDGNVIVMSILASGCL